MTQIVGRRLGRYEVQQEIGRGGMARVYRATDTLLQRQVAIKVLAPQLGLDPEFAQRFEREAITAANLRHPAIVTVYDVGEHDGLRFIAMELIRGRSLHAILAERGALGLGFAVALLDPVARALDFAHSQGSVHRDVKPHNIMVCVDGRVLLTDFGIAQAPEHEPGERLTRTGIFMGTPEYISPEQAESRRVDGRSDLYSLGIVAYEVITGEVPFSGGTPALIVAHAQQQPPSASSMASGVPTGVDTVLARALAKSKEARFASGEAMIEALRVVARRSKLVLPGIDQVAALAQPRADARPTAGGSVPVPDLPTPPVTGDPTLVGSSRPAPTPAPVQVSAPAPVSAPTPATPRRGLRPLLIVGPLLAALVLALLLIVFSNQGSLAGGGANPTPSAALPTPNAATVAVVVPPTGTAAAPTEAASPTEAATATLESVPPTEIVVLPTEAPAPPTETDVPPTKAPVPPTRRPPQRTVTATAEPPTATIEATTATSTATAELATATVEVPTATAEPPTATAFPTIVTTPPVPTATSAP